MLLDELLESFGPEAGAALAEAEHDKAAGREGWWRLQEAALLAVAASAERLVEMAEDEVRLPLPPFSRARGAVRLPCLPPQPPRRALAYARLPRGPDFCSQEDAQRAGDAGAPSFGARAFLSGLLESVVHSVLAPGSIAPPLLTGRALWALSRLADALPPALRAAALRSAVAGLAEGSPAPVAIGACRALAALCSTVPADQLALLSDQIYSGEGGGCATPRHARWPAPRPRKLIPAWPGLPPARARPAERPRRPAALLARRSPALAGASTPWRRPAACPPAQA